VVIINNDNWLLDKKHFVVMPETERAELIREFPFVDRVYITKHIKGDTDRSVCAALEEIKPTLFANGGDRFADNIPEVAVCKKLGIDMVFNIGGGKVQSSSDMVRNAHQEHITTRRPWGFFKSHEKTPLANVKTLHISPGNRLSLQKHAHRGEYWMLIEGDVQATFGESKESLKTLELTPHELLHIPVGMLHRASSRSGGTLLEVTSGTFDENDNERVEDDYNRV
jgi:mannose-6-phosphate isomerase-like protein (cupin superfamily)